MNRGESLPRTQSLAIPFLTRSAEEAAQRARFTPTVLNGQPVRWQGVITYNFVLQ